MPKGGARQGAGRVAGTFRTSKSIERTGQASFFPTVETEGEKIHSGRGGPRPGSGKPKGSIKGLSKEGQRKVAMAMAEEVHKNNQKYQFPEDIQPLDLLLAVVRDNNLPMSTRIATSIAAAPYVHPRLNNSKIEVKHTDDLQDIMKMVADERKKMLEREQQLIDVSPAELSDTE